MLSSPPSYVLLATLIVLISLSLDTQNPSLSIEYHSELFTSDEVVVILEWTYSTSGSYNRQLTAVQNVSVNVVPALRLNAVLVFIENTSIILMLQYNTVYNVSITQLGICGQPNQTAFIELNYCTFNKVSILLHYIAYHAWCMIYHAARCSNPLKLAHIYVTIEGYEDPALEGENITFICPPGSMLSGPNSSTCMRNGEWEPHPKDVACTGSPMTTRSKQ